MAKSICEHIRNVKSSLENAEKSFRENNGMRGELDLMLAEAEIKHLREKRGWGFCLDQTAFSFACCGYRSISWLWWLVICWNSRRTWGEVAKSRCSYGFN